MLYLFAFCFCNIFPFAIIFLHWLEWTFISAYHVVCFYFIISCVCVCSASQSLLKATLINTAPLNLTDNALLNVTLKLKSYTVGSIKPLPAWIFLRIKMITIRATSQRETGHLLLNPQAPYRCILVSLNAHPRAVWKPEEAKTHQWYCKGLVTQPKLSGLFRDFMLLIKS